MVVKGGLFVAAGVLACAVLALRQPTLKDAVVTAVVFGVGAWCCCRAYYFAFYVIGRYCDPGYRYAGIVSAVRWVVGRRRGPD